MISNRIKSQTLLLSKENLENINQWINGQPNILLWTKTNKNTTKKDKSKNLSVRITPTIGNQESPTIELIKKFIKPIVDLGRKIPKLSKLSLILIVVPRDQISTKIGIDQGPE